MAYVMALLVLVLIVGIVARVALAFGDGRKRSGANDDVTDRDVIPPAHPDEPIPGSDAWRSGQGKP
jgi:hypothetical protein